MPINSAAIEQLYKMFDKEDADQLYRLASKVDNLEAKWRAKLADLFDQMTERMIQDLIDDGKINSKDYDFESFFMEHSLAVMMEAMKSTERLPRLPTSLAVFPKGRLPQSLKALRELWDRWRKKGEVPPRQRKIVERVKKAYIGKCQDVWRKYSEDFRAGKDMDKEYVIAKVKQASMSEFSRSKMIVETETTRYWNQVRRNVYDESPDVTHYLFVPVRDYATTEWCSTRSGLVYSKDDPLLDKETPPIHWNCRSEILPLTPLNPKHRTLINDKSRSRRQHQCKALPQGWNT